MKKKQKKSSEDPVRMILKSAKGLKRLTLRTIAREYPELRELVKVL